jgi:1-acyl-sn-glycerol-3-phosphate acyltransferase
MVVRRSEPAPVPHGALTRAPASALAYAGPMDALVRVARGLSVALAILLFWSGAFLLAWFVVPFLLLRTRDRIERRRSLQRMVAWSWRGFLRATSWATIYRATYIGELTVDGPCVLIANHPSLLDVVAIIARMPHACCVVKSSLVQSPLVGPLLRAVGHVAAGDGTLMAGVGVLDAVRERLQEGFPVLVFPEGTRSPLGGIRRFRRGAFEIAQRAGVPVVPLFLRCDPPALGKGTPVWRHPRRCPTLTVQIDPPLYPDDPSPAALCKNVENDFRSRLGLPGCGEESEPGLDARVPAREQHEE